MTAPTVRPGAETPADREHGPREAGLTSGTPTTVTVASGGGRTYPVRLETGTFLRPRVMRRPGPGLRVVLAAVRASLCAGDDLRLHVNVGPGAHLDLVDPNGTVAYNARGGRAAWRVDITLAEGARMTWTEPSFIVSEGADVLREITVSLAAGARLAWRETLVLGRTGERGGALRSATRVTHGGRELLVEDLDLRDAELRELPGVLGGDRVIGQVAALGSVPDGPAGPHRLDLAGPGVLWRALARRTYESDRVLDEAWRAAVR
ncbi:urease accessory protein UreD [Marinactinospora rubrisoli]|uniref:Urease accessory protein UreD n=1 Tax=Marinactinospora rubrisoli TaxID=2715399 RepID=A0ABW2KK27_9ACTN